MKNKFLMIRFINLSFLSAPFILLSCSETKNFKNDVGTKLESTLEININGQIFNNKDKEIVAFEYEKPIGVNFQSGLAVVWYQTRKGIIGVAKVKLTSGKDSLNRTIYWGKKWLPQLGTFIENGWNNQNNSSYNNWIIKHHKWAFSLENAKNAKAYKLTPVEIQFLWDWTPFHTAEYKQ